MEVAIIKNGSFVQRSNSVEEAIETVRGWYANIIWQERKDTIEVRNIVIESNGYEHTGHDVLFERDSSYFWSI